MSDESGGGWQNTAKPFAGHGSASPGRHLHRCLNRERADLAGLTRVRQLTDLNTEAGDVIDLSRTITTSVLSQFSDSRLDAIQLATAPTHSEIFDERVSTAAGRPKPYTCVSLAYMCGDKPWLSITEISLQ